MQREIQTPHYKFTIAASDKRVQMTAIDNNTSQVFQSEWTELVQINPLTISAALKHENQRIKYEVVPSPQALILTISVNLDLLPKITEQLVLTALKREESEMKIQMGELTSQLAQIEQKIKQILASQLRVLKAASFPLETTIHAGRHLLQLSGYLMNRDYSENYDQFGNYIPSSVNIHLNFYKNQEEGKLAKQEEYLIPITIQDYEAPFKLTTIVESEKGGKAVFLCAPGSQVLSGCILTATSL